MCVHSGWRTAGTRHCLGGGGGGCYIALSSQSEERASFPEGNEVEEGGFLSMVYLPGNCMLKSLAMQGTVGQAVSPTVPSGPSLLGFACVCVYLCECLLVLWISVFVCHFGQGVAGLAGG